MKVDRFGDRAVRFVRPAGVNPAALLDALRAAPGAEDVVVTEDLVCVVGPVDLDAALAGIESRPPPDLPVAEITLRYDGPDLASVAATLAISVDDVIALHLSRPYTVKLVGFLPAFAYLGPVDDRLALPRRASPRPRVPAGAVGLAAGYTGVYPFASPGGWHLIATAVDFTPFSLRLGQPVRFRRVSP